jgi:hypothetical protein
MSLSSEQQYSGVEVVMVAAAPDPGSAAAAAPAAPPLNLIDAAQAMGIAVKPLFPDAAVHASAAAAAPPSKPPNPELAAIEEEQRRFFVTQAPTDGEARQVASKLRVLPGVGKVYIKPAVESPLAPDSAGPPSPATTVPNFSIQQGYLDAAPGGVGARTSAWAHPGGKGEGVRFVDIEGGWTLEHIDFRGNSGGLIGGHPFTDAAWTNHGTAVLGEFRGDDNSFGVVGIAPQSTFHVVSHQGLGSAGAIDRAASALAAGDIMLLEMHRPGPRFGFVARNDQRGYIAVEWWPVDFLAIRRAVLLGIIVVEAAGNGAENLDDPLYDQPDPSFPDSWDNPFRDARDSGAIVVGAGAPPSGQFGPDRSRLDFSNFGSHRLHRPVQWHLQRFTYRDRGRGMSPGHRACPWHVAGSHTGKKASAGSRQPPNREPCRRRFAADRQSARSGSADRAHLRLGIGEQLQAVVTASRRRQR